MHKNINEKNGYIYTLIYTLIYIYIPIVIIIRFSFNIRVIIEAEFIKKITL